jgi:hypothetical protein
LFELQEQHPKCKQNTNIDNLNREAGANDNVALRTSSAQRQIQKLRVSAGR